MKELLERLRAATSGDRSLDVDVGRLDPVCEFSKKAPTGAVIEALDYFNSYTCDQCGYSKPQPTFEVPGYTRSLDAIVGLIERKLAGWTWKVSSADKYYSSDPRATLLPPPMNGGCFSIPTTGKTAPLALCIAFLEALIAQEKKEESGN